MEEERRGGEVRESQRDAIWRMRKGLYNARDPKGPGTAWPMPISCKNCQPVALKEWVSKWVAGYAPELPRTAGAAAVPAVAAAEKREHMMHQTF